jgi:spore maturation protein CgeB
MVYVGTLATTPDRDSCWINAFRDLGIEVVTHASEPIDSAPGLLGKISRRFHLGRANRSMQQALLARVAAEHPDWVHFRLPVEFDRGTIEKLKKMGVALTQYYNDDAFSRTAPFGFHWKFRRALTAYDGHFVFRSHNVERYRMEGAAHVEHCGPSYDPRRHFPVGSVEAVPFIADAAFIGHWENDWRVDCLDALARRGFDVILRGGGWSDAIKGRAIAALEPVTHAFGAEYNRIYSNVMAGLCFFSKINNDTWTDRAFEIVAVGGLLVCERTPEAQAHFVDRQEAFFFSSIDELLEIVSDLKANPAKRAQVRAAGYRRLLAGKNTIDFRAAQILRFVTAVREARHAQTESSGGAVSVAPNDSPHF